ncbi:MAG: acyltransferase [Psychroflexus sp.]
MRETGRNKFQKFKKIIEVLVLMLSVLPKSFVFNFLKFFRNTNNNLGLLIRYVLVKVIAKSCGDNVSIQPGVYLFNIDKISLGNNISIHPMCYIDGAGSIEIGNDVSIAHNTSILSANHNWEDYDLPIKYNKQTSDRVVINDDVWIGCGVRIMAGISIGSRSVVAAGAVVSKNVNPNSLMGGVPAKKIKDI